MKNELEKRSIKNMVGDKILLQRIPVKEKTEGGLYIPDVARDNPDNRMDINQLATVLKVGEDAKRCKAGDVVITQRYCGFEFNVGNKELLICKDSDILAIIENYFN